MWWTWQRSYIILNLPMSNVMNITLQLHTECNIWVKVCIFHASMHTTVYIQTYTMPNRTLLHLQSSFKYIGSPQTVNRQTHAQRGHPRGNQCSGPRWQNLYSMEALRLALPDHCRRSSTLFWSCPKCGHNVPRGNAEVVFPPEGGLSQCKCHWQHWLALSQWECSRIDL